LSSKHFLELHTSEFKIIIYLRFNFFKIGSTILSKNHKPTTIQTFFFKIIKRDLFDENQLFSMLKIIQNFENRRDIFREEQPVSFDRTHYSVNELNNEMDIVTITDDSAFNNDRFDEKTWSDFLNQISKRIAENFVKIEVSF
jgi:hypothetical protein